MKKLRAAAYCRVSTLMDSQDGSFETQMNYYRSKLSADCYELVDVYGDHGKSGREMDNRPEFQRMMADVEAGKIDIIFCKSISRFARNMAECMKTIRHLKELGVVMVFERENLRTDTLGVDLILSIMATIAEEESHSISQNMLQVRNYKNSVGEPFDHPCYGYRKVGKGWKVEPTEAERVRRVYQMAAEGCTYDEMLDEMLRMEEVQPTRRWSKAAIRYMLLNERYTGNYLTNKVAAVITDEGKRVVRNDGLATQYMIEGHHEALVSEELHHLVGKMVLAGVPQGNRKNRSMFDGLLREAKELLRKEAA